MVIQVIIHNLIVFDVRKKLVMLNLFSYFVYVHILN